MPPTSKKLRAHIGFGLCVRASVHASVRPCVRSSKTVHARILKFHIWIPHGKIFDARFFFFFFVVLFFVFFCLFFLFVFFLVRVVSLSGVIPL